MTVNEVITECVTYPYSKEAYDIQKDIYECELTAMALDSMAFQESNEDFLVESGIDDGFIEFTEKKGEKAYHSFSNKKNGVWSKVLGGLKSLVAKIINFFTAIGDKFTKQQMRIKAIRKFLATAHASEALANKIKDRLNEGANKTGQKKQGNLGLVMGGIIGERFEQPELSLGNFAQYFDRREKLTLQAALSLTWIKVAPVALSKGTSSAEAANKDNWESALSADVLSHYIQKFCISKGEASKLREDIRKDIGNYGRDGIKITVAGNSLQRAINNMKKSKTTLEKASKHITSVKLKENEKNQRKSKLSDTKEYEKEAKMLNKSNEAFTLLKLLTGNTIRLYKSIAEGREKIVKTLYSYISKKGARKSEAIGKERKAMDVDDATYSTTQTESVFDDINWDDAEDYSESYDDLEVEEMGYWFN